MTCKCIETMDAALAEYNTCILMPMLAVGSNPKPFVETYQVERGRGKRKAVKVFASFCPFCGVKYPDGDQ